MGREVWVGRNSWFCWIALSELYHMVRELNSSWGLLMYFHGGKLDGPDLQFRGKHPSFISLWIKLASGRLLICFTVIFVLSANGNLCG